MLHANNYRGNIPLELYIKLQNFYPQYEGESDATWLSRVQNDPGKLCRMFSTREFNAELIQAVSRRTMAQAHAKRVGRSKAGPALIKLTKPGDKQAVTTIAQRYRNELMINNESQYKYATEAYQQLLEQFDAFTPRNGSIFWNGINELALAKLVDKWNNELQSEIFGQLEATTSARYVNKQFEWEKGGTFEKYFTEVSDNLGSNAKGHVTSVVRCGLRDDSIFTTTELPRMLNSMEDQIKRKQVPTITDLTIVVIEPKHLENKQVAVFTNNEISMIPIVHPNGRYINSREDCTINNNVALSIRIREYWTLRGKKPPSVAATKIRADCEKLIKWV